MTSTLPHTPRAPVEVVDGADDPQALRRCLGQYPTGVTIITARHEDRLVGMAVNSFASVSLEPPMVLWSIRRNSRSATDFLLAGHFAVSVLGEDQMEVSQVFGGAQTDRFDRVAWQAGLTGAPLIDGATAHLECRTETVHDGGDHYILIGRVLRHARYEGSPLVFSQGHYSISRCHPRTIPASRPGSVPENAPGADLRIPA